MGLVVMPLFCFVPYRHILMSAIIFAAAKLFLKIVAITVNVKLMFQSESKQNLATRRHIIFLICFVFKIHNRGMVTL